jgi:hypothetical protein
MAVEDNTRMTFITEEDKQKLRDAASRDIGKKTAMMKGLHLSASWNCCSVSDGARAN